MCISKTFRTLLLTALLILGTTPFFAHSTYAKEETITQTEKAPYTASQIISATNKARAEKKLMPLTAQSNLSRAAQLKAEDMAEKGYFAHTSPDGLTPWYWYEIVGYDYTNAGENLASGFTTTKSLMNGWLNSPGHKANIMNKKFTDIGIGVAQAERNGKKVWYVVQMFGAR